MARAYGTATLTLTVSEAITLNSKDEGQTHTHTIASVSDIYRRTTSIPTANTSLVGFGASSGLGTFAEGDVKYIRLTNLDNTNHVIATFTNENSDEFAVKIDKGQSFVVCPDTSSGVANIMEASMATLSFTDATCDYNNDPTIGCDANANIRPGLAVSGTGIPASSFVKSVNTLGAVTSFELGDAEAGSDVSTTTGAVTNGTLTFSPGLADLTGISVKADTAACDVEVYIALT
tara:strand:+ start:898 stop:1596 length:699 start_codon:yes stop_codon:yes gene_type:complete